jgi:hypothetical protein
MKKSVLNSEHSYADNPTADRASQKITGKCKSCGKAATAIRCPPCYKEFCKWVREEGEAPSAEVYVPQNRWDDFS